MSTEDTPLITACCEGNAASVAALLAYGVSVNEQGGNGVTPLYITCFNGHTETASVLLAAGAAVNPAEQEGANPLYVACLFGPLAVVQLLGNRHDGAVHVGDIVAYGRTYYGRTCISTQTLCRLVA